MMKNEQDSLRLIKLVNNPYIELAKLIRSARLFPGE